MTNTFHRYGSRDSFKDDYIVFAIPARGINDKDAVEKQSAVPVRSLDKYNPVNMGDASHGAVFRPSKDLNPLGPLASKAARDFDAVINGVSCPTTVSAVFDNPDARCRLREGPESSRSRAVDQYQRRARKSSGVRAGAPGLNVTASSIRLGFLGQTDRMADRRTLELVDDVRPWHAVVQPRSGTDGMGQTGKTLAGTGFCHPCPFLQLWSF